MFCVIIKSIYQEEFNEIQGFISTTNVHYFG